LEINKQAWAVTLIWQGRKLGGKCPVGIVSRGHVWAFASGKMFGKFLGNNW